jgi:polyphosphate kinase
LGSEIKIGGVRNPLINREISWLSFNDRVLQEAFDPTVPLVERIKFLGIFSSNLDEFFRVRVASIQRLAELKNKDKQVLNFRPKKLLGQIQKKVIEQQKKFDSVWKDVILKELAEHKIFIINEYQLNVRRGEFVRNYFREKVLPTLAPLMLDNLKTFPELKDKSIYLFTRLSKKNSTKAKKHVLIEIPTEIHNRFLVLPDTGDLKYIILLDDVIRYCLDDLFPTIDYDQYDAYTIKITRDAELDLDSDMTNNMVELVSKSIKQRKRGKPVRLSYDQEMHHEMLAYLVHHLKLIPENIIPGGRYHNFKDFISFPNVGDASLEYPQVPVLPAADINLRKNLFDQITKKDYLFTLPYQYFEYILHLLREAAIDPKVKSIEITIYRVAKHSAIMNALINAARNGKKITVMVELKARFDEENNLYYSERLQEEGIEVIHGPNNKKVHAKLCLITRREENRNVHYSILSTGNFNEKTAKIYSDHYLFTADKEIGKEVHQVFQLFRNPNTKIKFHRLLVASQQMRLEFENKINFEISQAKQGKKAFIYAKMNSLMDTQIALKLYEASRAGVEIKLIVRGVCNVIPGVKGLSERIEIISIVDRYLEHTRLFIFCNAGKTEYYLSSADWMTRNLDHRIEVAFPVLSEENKKLLQDYFLIQWSDNVKARKIDVDHSNKIVESDTEHPNTRAQIVYFEYLKKLIHD